MKMKTLKFFLFALLALSMITTCSEDNTQGQGTDNSDERDLLKSKLTGEWVVSNQKDIYIYTFADNDTIYIKTSKSDIVNKWPYRAITADSIRIIRDWTTHNKVVFYSNDSIWMDDFIPSDAAVYPPVFFDATLVRREEISLPDEKPELVGTKWKLKSFVTNGNAKTPEQDSNNRYWLVFKDDSSLDGRSYSSALFGTYELNCQTSSLRIIKLMGTEVNERFDGKFLRESLTAVRSFDLSESTLKLYYNETDYLLFNVYRDSESEPPLVLTVADFNVPSGCSVKWSNMQHDSVYVINSEEELATFFTCESNPQIDFSTKTLLVAYGGVTNGIAAISKELLLANNIYTLAVDITLGVTAVAEIWRMVLVTDKINAQSVTLDSYKHFGQ